MTITAVTPADIPQITALQDRLLLPVKNLEDGFLVSAFSAEQYGHFIEKYEYFYKASEQGELLGVLMAYRNEHIVPEDANNSLIRAAVIGDFVLVKQIFLAPEAAGKGVAKQLYRRLFADAGEELPFVCAIVLEPFNKRSCEFHKRLGFSEFLDFTPVPDKDGVVRKRSAWIRPPRGVEGMHGCLRVSNVFEGEGDEGEVLASRAATLVSLYQHEDNLNWTKFGMQTTVLFALFASFAYFYEKSVTAAAAPVLGILGGWGVVINLLFMLKIYSGLRYMNTYKRKVREYDDLLTFYYPHLARIFRREEYIARTSITCRLMFVFSLIGLLSWVCVSILLLLKVWRIYVCF